MPIDPGTKLGPYEIVSQLGRGGMGEVYRARDPRLNRDVAIKVSVEAFNPRFEREARAVAALNHPNICQIYDIGPDYIVMELVEGAEPRGPMPVADTLKIARQVALALEAAHEKGIVHRDLKPANVKVRNDGTVKVLDFGLARLNEPEAVTQDDTLTGMHSPTRAGTIIGTPSYMSPEQARGKDVDKRTDIWAFGVMMYELATGDPLFRGETHSDTIAHVLTREPDLARLPGELRPLVSWCLQKDTTRRLRDVGDSLPSIDRVLSGTAEDARPIASMPVPARRSFVWPAVALGATLAAAAIAFVHFRETAPRQPDALHFQIRLPDDMRIQASGTVVMSPDGKHIAFPASTADGYHIVVQDFDGGQPRVMTATRIGNASPPFFWAPDSRYLAYSDSGPTMSAVDITTGEVRQICTKPAAVVGGSWNDDGTIIFGTNTLGLFRVSSSGGEPVLLTKPNATAGEASHQLPMFLPDGRRFLYFVAATSPEASGEFLRSIDDPPDVSSRLVVRTRFNARLVADPDGRGAWLLYLNGDRLMARRFNLKSLEVDGPEMVVPARVGTAYNTALFFSSPQALVYRSGGTRRFSRFVWTDASGVDIGPVGEPASIEMPHLSPDETRVSYIRAEPNGTRDVWVLDIARGISTRVTFGDRYHDDPIWSPDGRELAFGVMVNGTEKIFRKRADGTGAEALVLEFQDQSVTPMDWSRDGRYLAYVKSPSPAFNRTTIGVVPMAAGAPAVQVESNPQFSTGNPAFSRDSRYLAYESDETGRREIYVQALFPEQGSTSKWLISNQGGHNAGFAPDGKRLIWAQAPSIWGVEFDTSQAFRVSTPRRLFDFGSATGSAGLDTKGRWLFVRPEEGTATSEPLEVIVNWQSALKPN